MSPRSPTIRDGINVDCCRNVRISDCTAHRCRPVDDIGVPDSGDHGEL